MPPITGKKISQLDAPAVARALADKFAAETSDGKVVQVPLSDYLALLAANATIQGVDKNFAKDNLTATANRTHDFDSRSLTINNLLNLILNTQGNFKIQATEGSEVIYIEADGSGDRLLLTATDLVNAATMQLFKAGNIELFANGFVKLKPQGASAVVPLVFKELNGNGDNHVGFKAPDAISANVVWVLPNADGSANQVLKTDGSGNLGWAAAGAPAYDSLTSGALTAAVTRFGGTATAISNPAAGEYTLTVQAGADFQRASIFGNNTTLNGSSEMLIRINNAANSRDRRVSVQLYDANNNALVDQQATGTVHTQALSGNITLIIIPGLSGFGSTGYYVEIR